MSALKVAKAPLQNWPAVAKYNSLGLSAHFFLMPVLWVQEQFLNVVKVMLQNRPQCRNHTQEQFLTSPQADSWALGVLPFHFQHAAPTHADSTLRAHKHARRLLAHTDALWKQRMCALLAFLQGPVRPGLGRRPEKQGLGMSLCPSHSKQAAASRPGPDSRQLGPRACWVSFPHLPPSHLIL